MAKEPQEKPEKPDKEPPHNDKEHENAGDNLDDKHWNDAHGDGTP